MSRVDDGLRLLLRRHVPPPVQWTTIETGFTQRGVPDLHGCADGADLWIECKAVRRGWQVEVRAEQVGWHVARHRCGGRSVLAVRRRVARPVAADELWLVAGWAAGALQEAGLSGAGAVTGAVQPCPAPAAAPHGATGRTLPAGALLGRWPGGPRGWPWPAVRARLLRWARDGD